MISSKKITLISICLVALALVGIVLALLFPHSATDKRIGTFTYGSSHTLTVTEDDYYTSHAQFGVAKIKLNVENASSDSPNVSVSDGEISIRGGGTYVLSGTYSGSIIVDCADSVPIRLVLNNATVTAKDFSALYIRQAEKTIISTVKGTVNSFTDAKSYNESKQTDTKPDAAIYSKDNLTINGEGTLIVNGQYADAIKSNDTLLITEGTLRVSATDEGINANDALALFAATVEITTANDALKCENTEKEKGFIVLENTSLTIKNASDDGIYASASVYIQDAALELTVGGDAVHAEQNVMLSPKSLHISKAYEGIEGAYIEINSGDISIVSTDDAINALGQNSTSGRGGMPMGLRKENISDEEIYLVINGGTLHLSTGGDGIDSNGAVRINGGNIQVYGPENSGNSSLDFEYGFIIDGGTLLAAGSSSMAESPAESSKQNAIVFHTTETYTAGTKIILKDTGGNEIISGTTNKRFNWVCVSTPSLKQGETYTLYINGTETLSAEVGSVVTAAGSRGRSR